MTPITNMLGFISTEDGEWTAVHATDSGTCTMRFDPALSNSYMELDTSTMTLTASFDSRYDRMVYTVLGAVEVGSRMWDAGEEMHHVVLRGTTDAFDFLAWVDVMWPPTSPPYIKEDTIQVVVLPPTERVVSIDLCDRTLRVALQDGSELSTPAVWWRPRIRGDQSIRKSENK